MKCSLVDDVDSTFLEALSPEQQIKVSEQKCPFCSKKYVYKSNFKKHLLEGCDTADVVDAADAADAADAIDAVDETVNAKSPLVTPRNIKRKPSINTTNPKTNKIKRTAKSPSQKTLPVPLLETDDIKDTNDINDVDTNDVDANDVDANDVDANDVNTNDVDTNNVDTINVDTNDVDTNESETQDIVDSHTPPKLNESSLTVHLSDVKMEENVDTPIPEEDPQQQNCETILDSPNSLEEVDSGRGSSTAATNQAHAGHQPLDVITNFYSNCYSNF